MFNNNSSTEFASVFTVEPFAYGLSQELMIALQANAAYINVYAAQQCQLIKWILSDITTLAVLLKHQIMK